jgi:hypothetical protein
MNDQNEKPSTHVPDGNATHDARGRFAKGNKLGKGNPLAGRAAKIRAILLESVTDSDARAIADKLISQSRDGDLAAIRELLDRTIGKPAASDVIERIEKLEAILTNIHKNGDN